MKILERFARFNAVGALGVGVQLTTLWVLVDLWGVGYAMATTVAVACAVVHNFVWHQHWTWGPRRTRGAAAALTFIRFAGTNGLVSIAGNLAVMVLLVGGAGGNPVAANVIAIVTTGLVNFATSDLFVFARSPSTVLDGRFNRASASSEPLSREPLSLALPPLPYSARNALMGSVLAARIAGMTAAITLTVRSAAVATPSVEGSPGVRSNSSVPT